jgi:hypothetical protein
MHRVAPLMIVNGPYAQQIGLRGGYGCFGPGFRANASMGRAIRLALLNLGGGSPRLPRQATVVQAQAFLQALAPGAEKP